MSKKDKDFNLKEALEHFKNSPLHKIIEDMINKMKQEPTLEEVKKDIIKRIEKCKTTKDLKHFCLDMAEVVLKDYHNFIEKGKR